MARPENVRCENCVFVSSSTFRGRLEFVCHLRPEPYPVNSNHWCGEFRSEWPGEGPRFGITGGCICGKCDSCKERGVPCLPEAKLSEWLLGRWTGEDSNPKTCEHGETGPHEIPCSDPGHGPELDDQCDAGHCAGPS